MNKGLVRILQIHKMLLFPCKKYFLACNKLCSPHIQIAINFFGYTVPLKSRLRNNRVSSIVQDDYDVNLFYGGRFPMRWSHTKRLLFNVTKSLNFITRNSL